MFLYERCQVRSDDSAGWTEVRRGVSALSPLAVTQMLPPQTPLQTGVRSYPFCVTRVYVFAISRENVEEKKKSFPLRSPPFGATDCFL